MVGGRGERQVEIWKALRKKGYDGIQFENKYEGGGTTHIPFSPTQIKSATGNVGTFDPKNPDIRFSRVQADAQKAHVEGIDKKLKEIKSKVAYLRQDLAEERALIEIDADAFVNMHRDEEALLKLGNEQSQLVMEKAETIRSAIYDYARKIKLNAETYNRVDTLLKNTKTVKGLKKAFGIMDEVIAKRQHRMLVKVVQQRMARERLRLSKIKGKTQNTRQLESNQDMAELLDSVGSLTPEEASEVEATLAAYAQDQTQTKDRPPFRLKKLDPETVAWLENPDRPRPPQVDRVLKNLYKDKLEVMSSDELQQLLQQIQQIASGGRAAFKAAQEAEVERLDHTAAAIAHDVYATTKKRPLSPAQKATEDREKPGMWRSLKELPWHLLHAESLIQSMVGYRTGSAADAIFKPLAEAAAEKIRAQKNAVLAFETMCAGIDRSTLDNVLVTVKIKDAEGKEVDQDLTYNKALHIYGHSKNPKSRMHLEGTGLDESVIDLVCDALPQSYRDVVDALHTYYDERQYPRLNEAYKKEHGIDMPREAFYFPIMGLDVDRADNAIAVDILSRASAHRAVVQRGFTRTRINSGAPFGNLDFVGSVSRNLLAVEHYIAMGDAIRKVNRVVHHPLVKQAMETKSKVAYDQILDWLDTMAVGKMNIEKNDILSKFALFARSTYAIYQLGFKITPILSQLSSLPKGLPYVSEHGPARSVQAVMSAAGQLAARRMELVKEIDEKSAVMANRMTDFERDMTEMFERKLLPSMTKGKRVGPVEIKDAVVQAAMWSMGANDKLNCVVLWKAAYDESLRDGKTEDEAVYAADDVIRKTQSGGGLIMMPSIYRGGVLQRMFSQFNSDPNKTINLLYQMAHTMKSRGLVNTGFEAMMVVLIPGTIFYMVQNAFKVPWDDPEEWGRFVVNNQTSGIPLLGTIIDIAMGGMIDVAAEMRGKKPNYLWARYAGDFNMPLSEPFETMSKALSRPYATAGEKAKSVSLAFLDAFFMFVGVPYGQIKRSVQGMKRVAELEAKGEEVGIGKKIKYFIWPAYKVEPNTVESAMKTRLMSTKWQDRKRFVEWYGALSAEKRTKFAGGIPDFSRKLKRVKSGLLATPETLTRRKKSALSRGDTEAAEAAVRELQQFRK
jgi:hypothetical protein